MYKYYLYVYKVYIEDILIVGYEMNCITCLEWRICFGQIERRPHEELPFPMTPEAVEWVWWCHLYLYQIHVICHLDHLYNMCLSIDRKS